MCIRDSVQAVEFPGNYTIQLSALCRSCFLDLIARHIHDYRRMVKILCYQLFCIEFPVIREVLRIIIIVFTSGPAVGKLIPVSYTHLDVYKRQVLDRLNQTEGEENQNEADKME